MRLKKLNENNKTFKDLARLERNDFISLLMSVTSYNSEEVIKVFNYLNDAFFDGEIQMPFILPVPSNGSSAGFYSKIAIKSIGINIEDFFSLNSDFYMKLLHEMIHAKFDIQGINDNNHTSNEWVKECKRILRLLGINIQLNSDDTYNLRTFPIGIINQYKGVAEHFERSVREKNKLEKLPDGYLLKRTTIEKSVIFVVRGNLEDDVSSLNRREKDYILQLAEEIKKEK